MYIPLIVFPLFIYFVSFFPYMFLFLLFLFRCFFSFFFVILNIHCLQLAKEYVDIRRNIAEYERYRSRLESALTVDHPDSFHPGPSPGSTAMNPEEQECADEIRQLEQENVRFFFLQ